MMIYRYMFLAMCVALGATSNASSQAVTGDSKLNLDLLEKHEFPDPQQTGPALPYRLLKPQNYDPNVKYPLVLFLHGAGERGTDNEKQLVHGVREFVKPENREKYPCFLVAPQCPDAAQWVSVPWDADAHDMPAEPSRPLRLALALVDALQREYSIDADRLLITGLSMGGYGTWDAISRHPDKFAAAVPVCGGGDLAQAQRIAQVPLWAFHGADDTVVKPQRSRGMIAAVKEAGGQPKYSELAGVGHDSWNPAYASDEMMAWLFAQKRPAR